MEKTTVFPLNNYWHDCNDFPQVIPSVRRFSGPHCNVDMVASIQLRRVNTASSQVSNLVSQAPVL